MQRRSFFYALAAMFATACGRAGQINGPFPQDQGKKPYVTLRVLGLSEPVNAVSASGTALEVLRWSLGSNAFKTRRFDTASGEFVEAIKSQGGNWVFEVNGQRLDTPGTSVDTYRLQSGDELIFRRL